MIREYLDSIRENLFESEVYVFTPKGDLIALTPVVLRPLTSPTASIPKWETTVAGARINDRMVQLDSHLHNGDIVSIITQKNASPSLDWVNFVATASARNRIRQWYKRSRREENYHRGRQLLERELGKAGLDALLKSERMQTIAVRLNYSTTDDLLAGLGFGETGVASVVNKLREATQQTEADRKADLPPLRTPTPSPAASTQTSEPIRGVEGMLYYIAGCCKPLPGDNIIGLVTRTGRGIAIHQQDCSNISKTIHEDTDRLVPVSWNVSNNSRACTYPVELQLEVIDRVGVLKDILSRLSDRKINVSTASVETAPDRPALMRITIDVAHREQLNRIVNQLRQLSDVLDLKCVRQTRGSS